MGTEVVPAVSPVSGLPLSQIAIGVARRVELLAKVLEVSQTEIAAKTGVSRVPLNRYLRGQTELRLSDFLGVLLVLGVDLDKLLKEQLAKATGQYDDLSEGLGADVQCVLQKMSPLGRHSYLGHLVAHAELLGANVPAEVKERLRKELAN